MHNFVGNINREANGPHVASLRVRVLIGMVTFLFSSLCFAQSEAGELEYQVKASLIFNFIQFIEWPPEFERQSRSTFNICLIGPDHFGESLKAIQSQLVRGRQVMVRTVENGDINECHVMFVSHDTKLDVPPLLQVARQVSALSIGESREFLDQGGVIRMYIENERVGFDINRSTALESRLNISSKLLRIARKVQ